MGQRDVISNIEEIKDGFDFEALNEMFRVLKRANFYIYANKDLLTDLVVYFKSRPEKLFMDILVEHITNPTPFCNNTYLNDTDYILFVRESGVRVEGTIKEKRKYEVRSTNVKDKRQWGHPTIKPVESIKRYIKNSTNENDIILDPFAGSCTTLVACKMLKRNYIGIEKEEKYVNICHERLAATTSPMF